MQSLSNPKHEKYCHYRALGETQADAYVKAFQKQDESKRMTWANMGYQLEKDSIIARRIEVLKDWMALQLMLSRQDVAKMYIETYSDPTCQHSAKVAAVNGLNKMLGYNEAIKIEVSSGDEGAAKTFASLFEDDEIDDQ